MTKQYVVMLEYLPGQWYIDSGFCLEAYTYLGEARRDAKKASKLTNFSYRIIKQTITSEIVSEVRVDNRVDKAKTDRDKGAS